MVDRRDRRRVARNDRGEGDAGFRDAGDKNGGVADDGVGYASAADTGPGDGAAVEQRYLTDNDALTNLRGLATASRIGGPLSILRDDRVDDIDALNVLTMLGGSLGISQNGGWVTVTALGALAPARSCSEIVSEVDAR